MRVITRRWGVNLEQLEQLLSAGVDFACLGRLVKIKEQGCITAKKDHKEGGMQVSGIEVEAFCFGNVEHEVLQNIQMRVFSMHFDVRARSPACWTGVSH